MKKMILLLGVLSSSPALAVDDFYEHTFGAPNAYMSGTDNTTFFSRPVSIPLNGTSITNVSWNWGQYTNGATSQHMRLCYRAQYSRVQHPCITISDAPIGEDSAFNGLSARGSFDLIHRLEGGSYPVYPTHSDTLRVDYEY